MIELPLEVVHKAWVVHPKKSLQQPSSLSVCVSSVCCNNHRRVVLAADPVESDRSSLSWQLVMDITHRAGELLVVVNFSDETPVLPTDIVYSQLPVLPEDVVYSQLPCWEPWRVRSSRLPSHHWPGLDDPCSLLVLDQWWRRLTFQGQWVYRPLATWCGVMGGSRKPWELTAHWLFHKDFVEI